MSRPRDTQRRKLYSAEQACFGWQSVSGVELKEWAALNSYVDRVLRSKWWRERVPTCRKLNVLDGRGRSRAGAGDNGRFVTFPKATRFDWLVLHELAHTMVAHDNGFTHSLVAWHGREFARAYLSLVRRFLGVEWERSLREHFKAHGVKWRPSAGEEAAKKAAKARSRITRPAPVRQPVRQAAAGTQTGMDMLRSILTF